MRELKGFICIVLALLMIVFVAGCDGNKVVTEDGRTNNDLKAEYSDAQKLIDEGKYEEAIKALDGIPDTYNKYSDVVTARTKAINLYIEDVIDKADSLSTENKNLDALDLLEKSKTLAGDNPLITSREDQIKVRIKDEVLSEVKNLFDQKEYEKAIVLITESPSYINEDSEVREVLMNCSVEYSIEQVKVLEDEGKNSEAIGLLKQQINLLGGNDVLQAMFEERLPEFKKGYLEGAEEKYYSEGYSAAIAMLQEAESIIGSDSDIEAKKSYFEDLRSKEPQAFSEDFASSEGGFFIKKGNDYYRLQRGGEYSNVYSCSELNMACTDIGTERIPVLSEGSQLVVFTSNLSNAYHVTPVQEIAFTFPVGLRKPGDGTAWGHTFDQTVRVYSNDSDRVEQYDIGDRNHGGLTIEEIDGMSYDEYWDAHGFDTQNYCDPSATFHWGLWGTRLYKMPEVTTVHFSYYVGTQYCEDEMTSYVKFYGFNGLNEDASKDYTAELGKTSYATIDVSDLSPGLYVLYGESYSKPPVYLFEKR